MVVRSRVPVTQRFVRPLAVAAALASGLGELGMLQRWRLREWMRQLLH